MTIWCRIPGQKIGVLEIQIKVWFDHLDAAEGKQVDEEGFGPAFNCIEEERGQTEVSLMINSEGKYMSRRFSLIS